MPPRPRLPEIRTERVELLDPRNVLTDFQNRAGRDLVVRLLSDEAQRRGGRLEDRPENVFGYRQTFDAVQPIRPLPGQRGTEVSTVEFEVQVQQYPTSTADQVAVGIATIRGGDNAAYPLLLEAPDSDFVAANEFTIVGDRIEPTSSWWTAVTGCLTRQCVTVCANSISTCIGGTWIQYVACIASNCGGCWVKCLACATCNCGWWCQWAVGCCHQ